MEAPVGQFVFPPLERVFFGPGSVARLGEELDRRGRKRALVVTGKTLGGSNLLGNVTAALGTRCVGVFNKAAQHAPADTVRALVAEAEKLEADSLISFGGGSPIDSAKVAIASLNAGKDMIAEAGELDFSRAFGTQDPNAKAIHIAVPTTLSAGEYTAAGGVTVGNAKHAVIDARDQPATVVNDPEMTLLTPEWLWVSTGMRALDHAVEAIYSRRHQILPDTMAAKAIRLLFDHLPGSIHKTGDAALAHRGHCQIAAWFSIYGAMNTGLGISHAMGHQIGPAWDVPHGYNSCITLPHAMRFMAMESAHLFGPIAEALDIAFDPEDPQTGAFACADTVADFIARFDMVPHALKDLDIARDQIGSVAEAIYKELKVYPVTERETTMDEINRLLADAYDGYKH